MNALDAYGRHDPEQMCDDKRSLAADMHEVH